MSKQKIIEEIAKKNDMSKAQANVSLNVVIHAIVDSLSESGQIAIGNFGTFSVDEAKPREGRNPQTGEKIQIPAKKRIKFKPAKKFKDKI
mgnify:CR=1 FL=1